MTDYTGPYGLADGVAKEAAGPPYARSPYTVQRNRSGAVVVCRAHVVTDEVKVEEAEALAAALNIEFQRRMTK